MTSEGSCKGASLPGWQRYLLSGAILACGLAVLRMPVVTLFQYGLLVALTVVVVIGVISTDLRRWACALGIVAAAVLGHGLLPPPTIDEGFNAFLPGPAGAAQSPLPADVYNVLKAQFAVQYPNWSECVATKKACRAAAQRAAKPPFAFSADAIYENPSLSRRVGDIAFRDPLGLRLGFLNDEIYSWDLLIEKLINTTMPRDVRDKRSLSLFSRHHVTFPIFIVERFPAVFAGSTLCWQGTVFWPQSDGHYDTQQHESFSCRVIAEEDTGRLIIAASILRGEPLAVTLHANVRVQMLRILDGTVTLVGLLGLLLVVSISPRRLVFPLLMIGLAAIVVTLVEPQFLGGMRLMEDGDDGLSYESFGRDILQSLFAGQWMEAFRGGEDVYAYTPGFRYFRALERFLFGDTFLGYLSAMLIFPFLLLALYRRFLPERWALVMITGFIATPLGSIFGTAFFDYIVVAERGYADAFAYVLLFVGIVLIIPPSESLQDYYPSRVFFGVFFLAMATFCRPNLILASGAMIAAAIIVGIVSNRFSMVVASIAGLSALAVPALHNYIFGHVLLLFSDNVGTPVTMPMPPSAYFRAAQELLHLNFRGADVEQGFEQMRRWLSGPQRLLLAIPLHAFAVAILVRVGVFGRGYELWLRVLALATLLQHGIGLCYVDFPRYTLGAWLLTSTVLAIWMQKELWPAVRKRWPLQAAPFERRSGLAALGTALETLSTGVPRGRNRMSGELAQAAG